MQILCHRKDRKVGKEIKMLGRGVGRILSWVGEYTPLLYFLSKIVYTDSTYQICLLSHASFRFLKSDASLFY